MVAAIQSIHTLLFLPSFLPSFRYEPLTLFPRRHGSHFVQEFSDQMQQPAIASLLSSELRARQTAAIARDMTASMQAVEASLAVQERRLLRPLFPSKGKGMTTDADPGTTMAMTTQTSALLSLKCHVLRQKYMHKQANAQTL